MPQHSDSDLNVDDGCDEGDQVNSIVAKLAAHPLDSCNPPPEEIPDLLDSLIVSEGRLTVQITKCEEMAQYLGQRLENIKKRFREAKAKNTSYKVRLEKRKSKNVNRPSKTGLVLETEERVLQEMCFQMAFIQQNFSNKIKTMASTAVSLHQDIFQEFLGQRHDHPGIEVANSVSSSCMQNCDWYQVHGPYEWSKKPYSNSWWEEMNHTNWDWLQIKDHIATAVSVGGGRVFAMWETFHANTTRFIPPWIQAEDFERWTMRGEMISFEDSEGEKGWKVVIKVHFDKPPAMIEQEKWVTFERIRKEQIAKGKTDEEVATYMGGILANIDIERFGEAVIDQDLVFDGITQMPGIRGRGPQHARWLHWWGYGKWRALLFERADQMATSSQNSTG